MTLNGKGFYIWQLWNCEDSDPDAIATLAKAADFSHVLIKVTDGTRTYNFDREQQFDRVPPVARALRAKGIQIWGWQYIYGQNPLGEARKAIQRVVGLELDGFVVNAEKEYKASGMDKAASQYMKELRNGLPGIPIGLSTYRFPKLHPQFPYSKFLERCDINMPQVYWMGASNPDEQLVRSMQQYEDISPVRPMIPTGFAFKESSYEPKPGEPSLFLKTAQEQRLTAANFWSWDSARRYLPEIWNEIRDYPWPSTPQPKDITQLYIDALNTHDPAEAAGLYTSEGVHVNASRTVQGLEPIQDWYSTLINQTLPNATFSLTGLGGKDNTRYMTWSATSSEGEVKDGYDTLGLLDGKIAYHYTFFTIN